MNIITVSLTLRRKNQAAALESSLCVVHSCNTYYSNLLYYASAFCLWREKLPHLKGNPCTFNRVRCVF